MSERTGGVPLFVEEVTRLLLDRGEGGGAHLIPPTLQQSLAARLDRLGEAREVAQIGAVLGRSFSYALLRDVASASAVAEAGLRSALDRLADADLLIAEGAGPEATYRFKHALIQDAAYDGLLKSRRTALHRRAAEILVGQPERASAEPEVIAHHFTEAGLDGLAVEWWGKAGDQALRRSAFQEAISHLGRAIAMADKASAAPTPSAKATTASASQRLKLQTSYGQATMYFRGYGSVESKTAFAGARALVAGVDNASERFDAYYGLLYGSMMRGELSSARETAESFLRDAENEGRMTEAAVAQRIVGMVRLWQGDHIGARTNLAEALRIYDPERDRDAKFRFAIDAAAAATSLLAQANWLLGDVARARSLGDEALARADETAHAPTRASVYYIISRFHMIRGDPETVMRAAKIPLDLGREHGMALFVALGEVHANWARALLGDRQSGMTGLREALAAYLGQGNKLHAPLFQGRLAELEADGPDADGALRRIDEALALANETGEHWTDALLHRLRGEILLKRHPANTASAEEAFLAAIALAREQNARSLGLQAALRLAKLHQSTDRTADAHVVLASVLEGFAPTPEMPEIAEAQALLAGLVATDEVKAAIAQRERRLHLQAAYGRAMMYSRGLGSEEKAAFARARTLAAGVGDASERFDAYYGLFANSMLRGEVHLAEETAESFLLDAENEGRMTEAMVARRCLGVARLTQGDFIGARANLAEALRLYDPERDGDARFRFGAGGAAAAAGFLAQANWALGDVERALAVSEEASARADKAAHAPTRALVYNSVSLYQVLRGAPEVVSHIAKDLVDLSREHGMASFFAAGEVHANWARARLGETEVSELRRALAAYVDLGNRGAVPLFQGLVAELEADGPDPDGALRRIDEALALASETGERACESLLHRLRGEILLKLDPANMAAAEEVFRTSIAVAHAQKARSFELRTALLLAKLHQSTGRFDEAHAVLSPVLEGLSPTPELPEICEAQALLASLGASG